MKTLSVSEISLVAGAGDCRREERPASLREPFPCPETEHQKDANAVASTINDFGGWLGSTIYDLTHPTPPEPAKPQKQQ